jgi:AraC-like DNA-binding protein
VAIGSVYRAFVELAREAGVDVDPEVQRIAGVSVVQLAEARLSPLQGRALVKRLKALTGDAHIGLHAAERSELRDLDVLGYIARHASCALDALEALARYPRLLGDTADVRLKRSAGKLTVELARTGDQRYLPDGADFAVASLFKGLATITQGRARCIDVHLPRVRPRNVAVYRRVFGLTPRFGAEQPALSYLTPTLLEPLPESDGRLSQILEQQAATAHASLPDDAAWMRRVRSQLGRGLARGATDIQAIAARCGVSERTLRRRLQDAGTSFRALSDEVRRVRTLELIEEGHNQVGRLAEAVGYRDPDAFARAFRRWTGVAPARYLAQRSG